MSQRRNARTITPSSKEWFANYEESRIFDGEVSDEYVSIAVMHRNYPERALLARGRRKFLIKNFRGVSRPHFAGAESTRIFLDNQIAYTVVTVLISVDNASAGISPDLIDQTSKPVQAGVLVARVGICGCIACGLNVRKCHDRLGFFDDRSQPQI